MKGRKQKGRRCKKCNCHHLYHHNNDHQLTTGNSPLKLEIPKYQGVQKFTCSPSDMKSDKTPYTNRN
jgi:hypothetical protein